MGFAKASLKIKKSKSECIKRHAAAAEVFQPIKNINVEQQVAQSPPPFRLKFKLDQGYKTVLRGMRECI